MEGSRLESQGPWFLSTGLGLFNMLATYMSVILFVTHFEGMMQSCWIFWSSQTVLLIGPQRCHIHFCLLLVVFFFFTLRMFFFFSYQVLAFFQDLKSHFFHEIFSSNLSSLWLFPPHDSCYYLPSYTICNIAVPNFSFIMVVTERITPPLKCSLLVFGIYDSLLNS